MHSGRDRPAKVPTGEIRPLIYSGRNPRYGNFGVGISRYIPGKYHTDGISRYFRESRGDKLQILQNQSPDLAESISDVGNQLGAIAVGKSRAVVILRVLMGSGDSGERWVFRGAWWVGWVYSGRNSRYGNFGVGICRYIPGIGIGIKYPEKNTGRYSYYSAASADY